MDIGPRRALVAALAGLALLTGCAGVPTERAPSAGERLEQGREAWARGDYEAALEPLRSAAAQGEARALYALGYLYFYGRGVDQDRARGIEMIRRSAKSGDPLAVEALGRIADARGISRKPMDDDVRGGAAPAAGGRTSQANMAPPPATDPAASGDGSAVEGGTESAAPKPGDAADSGEPAGKWLSQRDPEHYTIELIALRDRDTVQRYRDLYLSRSPPPQPVQVVETMRRGVRWLLLVMGDYADPEEARRAIDALPPLLKAGKPKPLQFRNLSVSGPQAALGRE
ncbi:SEL1-like repeat protein [Ectothiorhodospiraceae bacterium WFHF3C12]|nr:SEL1-like repeat protein [Ectothiorhodospiraceae bacterium WFHF3C12]